MSGNSRERRLPLLRQRPSDAELQQPSRALQLRAKGFPEHTARQRNPQKKNLAEGGIEEGQSQCVCAQGWGGHRKGSSLFLKQAASGECPLHTSPV